MLNKTKVVVTVGPATAEKEQLRRLIENGMDVVRINMSHADYNFCREIVEKVNELNEEMNLSIATMMDLMGPEIRIGKFANGQAYFRRGDKVSIHMDPIVGDSTKFSVNYKNLIKEVHYNSIIKIKDGLMLFEVVDMREEEIICEVLTDGILEDSQSVFVEGIKFSFPKLTKKDENDILYANKLGIDFLALSHVTSKEEVLAASDLLVSLKNDHMCLISKIETQEAVDNLREISEVSDGMMVARGDLGVELPLERVPGIQKKIIKMCHEAGIVSIVATEMLSSMEKSVRPTRAEVSDVANAVLDGADAVMLSNETTIGKYPVETLNMMEKIINTAELDMDYLEQMQSRNNNGNDITSIISYNVAESASRLKAKAIIAPTMSGYTARKMSNYRPCCPVIAVSPNINTVKSLQLHFAVNPVLIEETKDFDKIMKISKEITLDLISTKVGDKIIVTGGYPFADVKTTNFMEIEEL